MAVNFNYSDSNSLLSINKSYQRLESAPLDNSEVLQKLVDIEEYAHNYPTAYEGQIVYCLENSTPYILVAYTGTEAYNLDYMPIIFGEITQKLVELEDYADMVGNDKLIPISNGLLNTGDEGLGLNADMTDGYNLWLGTGLDFEQLRLDSTLDANTIYFTRNNKGYIAEEQIAPGYKITIFHVDTVDEMLALTDVSYSDLCVVNDNETYIFSNVNYYNEKTTAASLISDWQLICGYKMFKTHFDELQTKINELEAKLQVLNDNAYTKSDSNEW